MTCVGVEYERGVLNYASGSNRLPGYRYYVVGIRQSLVQAV